MKKGKKNVVATLGDSNEQAFNGLFKQKKLRVKQQKKPLEVDKFYEKKEQAVIMKYFSEVAEISFEGYNLSNFYNELMKQNIDFTVLKSGKKKHTISVPCRSRKNVVAILEKFWYNDIKIKQYVFKQFLKNNLGIIIGLSLSLVMLLISNCFLWFVKVDAPLGKSDIVFSVLEDLNVSAFCNKSNVDHKEIEKKLFATGEFSFVSAMVHGSNLYIKAAEVAMPIPSNKKASVFSPVVGEVINIVVHSGTAKVNVGDKVNKGDLLVGGYLFGEKKNNTMEVEAKAEVTIRAQIKYSGNFSCDFIEYHPIKSFKYREVIIGSARLFYRDLKSIGYYEDEVVTSTLFDFLLPIKVVEHNVKTYDVKVNNMDINTLKDYSLNALRDSASKGIDLSKVLSEECVFTQIDGGLYAEVLYKIDVVAK